MDILYCILITATLGVLLHWGVMIQLERRRRPEYLRRYGVIVRRVEALEATGEVVGTCIGFPIFGSVRFKGMEYEFAGIVPTRYQGRIGENELYLEPGFLYTTGAGSVAPTRPESSGRTRR